MNGYDAIELQVNAKNRLAYEMYKTMALPKNRSTWSGNRTDRGILGVTFLCIGIGLHVRGRKKYLHFSSHCNGRGSAKKNGERT